MLPFKKWAVYLAVKAGVPVFWIVREVHDHVYSRQEKRVGRGKIRVIGIYDDEVLRY